MGVVVDADTEALMSFMENPIPAIEQVIDEATKEMKGPNGIMRKRFERKAGTQRTYEKLKPSTLKRKKKLNQKNILVAHGTLKGKTLASMKGDLSGNKINFKAKVPDYGVHVNDRRRYFSMDGKDGRPMAQDVKELDKTFKRSFVKVMRSKNIRYKP